MAKEKLWTMGNRVPSEFVTELEMARREAEQHRKATPEAWQDYVALRKLVDKAVSKLLVLEDERADFTRRLTIDPPPAEMKPEDADALCQDAVAGTLGYVCQDAASKGWAAESVYRAMIAYGHYMLAFERKAMGSNPQADYWAPGPDDEYGIVPPYGTQGNASGSGSGPNTSPPIPSHRTRSNSSP